MPLDPIETKKLEYVDRAPNQEERLDQKRISFLVNNECPTGAEYKNDNTGTLNRVSVELQKNVVTNLQNIEDVNASLKETIELVNSHDVALGDIGDDNLANKLGELSDIVEPMPEQIQKIDINVDQNTSDLAEINNSIGSEDDDNTKRSIKQDLFFIKKRIGNKSNTTVNGYPDPSAEPSGILNDIVIHGQSIEANTRNIESLTKNWNDSDIGNLKAVTDQMRAELGEAGKQPQPNVFAWSEVTQESIDKNTQDIADIKEFIGEDDDTSTIIEQVRKNKEDIVTLNDSTAGIKETADDNATKIGSEDLDGSILSDINNLEFTAQSIIDIVGRNSEEGLQGNVSEISGELGTDENEASIKGRMYKQEGEVAQNKKDISTLLNQVGVNTEDEETGLFKIVKDNAELIDAPEDTTYLRKGEQWVQSPNARGGWSATEPSENILTGDYEEINIITEQMFTPKDVEVAQDKSRIKFLGEYSPILEIVCNLNISSDTQENYKLGIFVGGQLKSKEFQMRFNQDELFIYALTVAKDDVIDIRVKLDGESETEITSIVSGYAYVKSL